MTEETYFQEAERLVNGARQSDYGHPLDNHTATADVWAAWLTQRTGCKVALSAEDVCWLNVLQKAVREANATKRDNAVDACGYLRNVEMIAAERSRRLGAELTRETEALGYDDPSEFQKTEDAAPSSPSDLAASAPSSPSDLVGRVVKRFGGREYQFPLHPKHRALCFHPSYPEDSPSTDFTIAAVDGEWFTVAEYPDAWAPVDAIAELA